MDSLQVLYGGRSKISPSRANPLDTSAEIYFYADSSTRKSMRTMEKLEHDKL